MWPGFLNTINTLKYKTGTSMQQHHIPCG